MVLDEPGRREAVHVLAVLLRDQDQLVLAAPSWNQPAGPEKLAQLGPPQAKKLA